MVKQFSILASFVVLFFPLLVFAHGTGTHFMGVVASLDTQHVVVKTKNGQTLSILLTEGTKYRKGKAAAIGTDLKVGDRVVVHMTEKGDTLTASEIRFSSASEKKGHEGVRHDPTKP